MRKQVSIKKITTFMKTGCRHFLIIFILLITAATSSGADSLTETKIPDSLSPDLVHLLNLADPHNKESFDPTKIKNLLDYIEKPKDPDTHYVVAPQLGSPSAYYEFDLRQNFEHILKYAFNPDVPAYLMTPSSFRLSHWKQVQGSGDQLPVLWDVIDTLDEPIILKGLEFVENTPDIVSGAYYSYHLYRTLIVFKFKNRKVIISISKQKDRSAVGKKGYVLGSDDNWDYFYSGKPGLSVPGFGWVRSYMYASSGINIYYEIDSYAPLLRCGTFKWLRAGWSKINAVKNHHIHDGMKRFAKSFKEIMEYPSLPGINAFSEAFSKIKAMPENELMERIKIYLNNLENRYGHDYHPSRAWSPKIFKDQSPWFQMSTEAKQSVLMMEYMKHALGKTDARAVVALLNFAK
ncbi:MAG: hypothetical protein KAS40_08270 [Desulfobacterales bacterium]|nr:hypothetical protein [Desulfobacterales bacterium]